MLFFTSIYILRNQNRFSIGCGILCSVATIVIVHKIYQLYNIFSVINDWDFLAFYLFGKVGISGSDFYNPENMANIFASISIPIEVSAEFLKEILQVGFYYPPVSMILFAPISYLDIETANVVWNTFVLSFLIFDIILIMRIFRTNSLDVLHILALVVLTLVFPATNSVISFNQTNFILLFFVLLIYENPDKWTSGLFLALAVVIKPIALIWGLYYLVNKKWMPLITLCICGILLIMISGLVFGFNNYISFFISPPTLRIPEFVYTETINQSLYSSFLRYSLKTDNDTLIANVKYIVFILSVALMAVTAIISYYLHKENRRFSFLIFIPLSLIIYPGSLSHYAVLLLPLFFIFISSKGQAGLLIVFFLILLLMFSSLLTSIILLVIIILYSFNRLTFINFVENNGD
jgi:hypothetical protein